MSEPGTSSRSGADCKGRWNVETLHEHFSLWLQRLEKHYDARITEIKDATSTALVAVKEQTASSFVASEKAILKTEEAQKEYNKLHNGLERKMEDEKKEFVQQRHFEDKIEALQKEINRLATSESASLARREMRGEHKQTSQWTASTVITVVFGLLGTLTFLFALFQFFLKARIP